MSTVFLADNFFHSADLLYPNHTITANEEATGHEAFRVGTYRRTPGNYWEPTTANSEAWVEVECDKPRQASMLVIDRGHNLGGQTVKLQLSDDDFSSLDTVVDTTVPDQTSQRASLDRDSGARTEEGAWMARFEARAATYWRLLIPAMGSGLTPRVRGLYLGLAWEPDFEVDRPFDEGQRAVQRGETQGPTIWTPAARAAKRKEWSQALRLSSFTEYLEARYHIEDLLMDDVPTWVVPEDRQAERSWLGRVASGTHAFRSEEGWGFKQAQLNLVEQEPELP